MRGRLLYRPHWATECAQDATRASQPRYRQLAWRELVHAGLNLRDDSAGGKCRILVLPHTYHEPAFELKVTCCKRIPGSGPQELGLPPVRMALRDVPVYGATVPEAAVHEDGCLDSREYDVRTEGYAGCSATVDSKAQTRPVQQRPKLDFRASVATAHPLHPQAHLRRACRRCRLRIGCGRAMPRFNLMRGHGHLLCAERPFGNPRHHTPQAPTTSMMSSHDGRQGRVGRMTRGPDRVSHSSTSTSESASPVGLRPKRRRRLKLVAARRVGLAVPYVCIVFTVFAVQPCCNPGRWKAHPSFLRAMLEPFVGR